MSARTVRIIRLALVVVMAAGILTALVQASADLGSVPWPSAAAVTFALTMLVATLVLAACSWVAILPTVASPSRLAPGFLIAQLGKYVPGGVVQLAGQFELARRAGVERRELAVAIPVHALCATAAPGAAGCIVLAIVHDRIGVVARTGLVLAGAVGLLVAVRRNATASLLDVLHRRWARLPGSAAMPGQTSMLRSFALGSAALACYGAAYAALLGIEGARPFALAAAGFVVAFTIGFVALPIPSGLGVREAVLVLLLEPVAPAAVILSAAVALRVLQLGTEISLAMLAGLVHRPDTRAADEGGPQ